MIALSTVEACAVVGLDRQRFNEYVSGGDYTIAPDTTRGKAREFADLDMIPLFVFADEIRSGTKPFQAGRLAEMVKEAIDIDPACDTVTIARELNSPCLHQILVGIDSLIDHVEWGSLYGAHIINLAAIRAFIGPRIDGHRDDIAGELVDE